MCCHFSRCSGIVPNLVASSVTFQSMVRSGRWVDPVVQDKVLTDSSLHHVNGMNGTNLRHCSRDPRVFDSYEDEYGGVVVNPDKLPSNPNHFVPVLRSSLSHWKSQV